jgi:nicotinamidase-related amidase
MFINIPHSWRKKALFIIDVQESFILERNKYILENIQKIIKEIEYDCIIATIAINKKDSLWEKQVGWYDAEKKEKIDEKILESMKNKNCFYGTKLAKSAFKCDNIEVINILKEHKIEEIHLTWFETNDCIFATAFEGFDLGYFTFVIEEACETGHTALNHTYALELMKYIKMTNNSDFIGKENIEFIKIKKSYKN